MIVLGLTGSIAMGKSTVARMMESMNIPVHDSDVAVHDLLENDEAAKSSVIKAFPDAQNPSTNTIDRKKLGAIVFADDHKREQLEKILHPLVQKSQQAFIAKANAENKKIVCLDIPLLFETGAEKSVDYTIVVTAPADIQRVRVLARPNMTEEKLNAILARQIPDAEKQKRADYIISTATSLAQTEESLKLVLHDIQKKNA